MIIRLWCEKHQIPLEAWDGAPELVVPDVHDEDPENQTIVRQGTYQNPNGLWEVDLSNVGCSREITSYEVEHDMTRGFYITADTGFIEGLRLTRKWTVRLAWDCTTE